MVVAPIEMDHGRDGGGERASTLVTTAREKQGNGRCFDFCTFGGRGGRWAGREGTLNADGAGIVSRG